MLLHSLPLSSLSFHRYLKLSSFESEEFNANDIPSRSLMMLPSAFPRAILSFCIPGDKTLSVHGSVLNGCVYDRISSVIKKALQCVWVSKRGRTSVVAVLTRSTTSTTSPRRDKTSTGGTAKFQPHVRQVEPNPSVVVYTRRVYWSNGKRDSWKLFALCAPDIPVPCVTYLVPRDRRSTSSSGRVSFTNMFLFHDVIWCGSYREKRWIFMLRIFSCSN